MAYFGPESEADFLQDERRRVLGASCPDDRNAIAGEGIALSGGGIRSATFCLGAMQSLANADFLKRFNYMSSVSGGGYTAGALQYWWTKDEYSGQKDQFPFGTRREQAADIDEKSGPLRFLRQHGNYLAPGDGLTLWSIAAVVIRTLLGNLLVWLSLTAGVMAALIGVSKEIHEHSRCLAPNVGNPLPAIPAEWLSSNPPLLAFPILFAGMLWVALALVAYLVFRSLVLAALTFVSRPDWNNIGPLRTFSTLAAAAFLVGAVILCGALFRNIEVDYSSLLDNALSAAKACSADDAIGSLAVLFRKWSNVVFGIAFSLLVVIPVTTATLFYQSEKSNYFWRRSFETSAGFLLPIVAALLVFGTVPLIPYLLTQTTLSGLYTTVGTVIGTASGLASALFGHFKQASKTGISGLGGALAACGAAIFLYAFLTASYAMGQFALTPGALINVENSDLASGVAIAMMIVAGLLAIVTNLNHVGLHRFYRDRIMEAFMPTIATLERRKERTGASEADTLSIGDLATGAGAPGPHLLVNTNIVLVNEEEPKYAVRGGDNFILSSLFVGSKATGWQDTKSYIERNGAMTLPSAVAASGAALNANSGYAGEGITRNRALSLLMTLLNLKLGLWVATPSSRKHCYRFFTPNHFMPGLAYALFPFGYKRKSRFAELSDGGHFDNIGLYELVRRRLALIVVVDAEADPKTSMPALVSVAQRIRQDFGTHIALENAIDALVPVPASSGFPAEVRYATAPFFTAPIKYGAVAEPNAAAQRTSRPAGSGEGLLVYVKASLVKEIDFLAKGFWAKYPDFPHQSTGDQFFDPIQFEAYRQLGYVCMEEAIKSGKLDPPPVIASTAEDGDGKKPERDGGGDRPGQA